MIASQIAPIWQMIDPQMAQMAQIDADDAKQRGQGWVRKSCLNL